MGQVDPERPNDSLKRRELAKIGQPCGVRAGVLAQAGIAGGGGVHQPFKHVKGAGLGKINVAGVAAGQGRMVLAPVLAQGAIHFVGVPAAQSTESLQTL